MRTRPGGMLFKSSLAVLGSAVAGGLLWFSAVIHLQRACVEMDTPYLPLCAEAPPESDPVHTQQLRDRLRANPGDSHAWVALANVESGAPQQPLLQAIATLAPSDPNSLRLRAQHALAQQQLPQATELLVKMADHRIGGAEPAQMLARLLATSEGAALLRPHLVAGSQWLPPVLSSMRALKLPMDPALPLLAEAAGRRIVPATAVRPVVRSLKAEGKWAEAYGLWLAQQPRQPVPLLFNGAFEHSFQPDGFDWQVTPVLPSRAGAVVSQRNMAGHGQVLEVQYNGRAVVTPVIRQHLFVSDGRYALQGQYMTSKLRMDQGLAWAVRCTGNSKLLAGRSAALQDTAGIWQNFRFEFTVPPDCGMAASLQLETFAPYEAAAGFRGTASFDRFELSRLGS
jgi:hypothetical protein